MLGPFPWPAGWHCSGFVCPAGLGLGREGAGVGLRQSTLHWAFWPWVLYLVLSSKNPLLETQQQKWGHFRTVVHQQV